MDTLFVYSFNVSVYELSFVSQNDYWRTFGRIGTHISRNVLKMTSDIKSDICFPIYKDRSINSPLASGIKG